MIVNPPATIGDFWINLSASAIAVILTVFFIDFLLERHKEIKWKDGKTTAKEDTAELINMLISYIAAPLGFTVFNYKREGTEDLDQWSSQVIEHIFEDIQRRNLSQLLNGMTKDKWQHLELNLLFLKQGLSENIQLYGEILPPELFGKLLKVRRSFNKFYFSFGLISDLFTKDESEWPLNKKGVEQNRLIRKTLLDGFTKDLKDYFSNLAELLLEFKKWKNEN